MKYIKLSLIFFVLLSSTLFFNEINVEAASSPYDVSNTVVNNWANTVGGKTFPQNSGRKLAYDVYSQKYTNGGYNIVSKNFGQGSQQYINFQGWAVLHGRAHHTSSNHETFVVARKVTGNSGIGTTKVYGTLPYGNLSATKELEYNSQGPTAPLYNECPSTATNKDNQINCNFRYENVGFDAYLPLQELFPTSDENASWELFIVKNVNGYIVYSTLNLPFEFSDKDYSYGKINLSSGINAAQLQMNDTSVISRTSARQSAKNYYDTHGMYRYFTKDSYYTRVASDETGTAVWYGVRVPAESNATRWANSAYWTFGGAQARISYIPEKDPPQHREHSISNHRFQNGNDYWVQPNDRVNIRLRGYDGRSLIKNTYLSLYGNGYDHRVSHDFNGGNSNYNYYWYSGNLDAFSGQRTYVSSDHSLREATFNVAPKTHGHNYRVWSYYLDNANNYSTSWFDTQMNLRVDGNVPSHTSNEIIGAKYINGNDYWVRPNDNVNVRLRQHDPDSGNRLQYLKLLGNGQDVRSLHTFYNSGNYNEQFFTSPHASINTASREENTAYGRVLWGVTPKTHGHTYDIQYYFEDNVRNAFVDYVSTGKRLRVDGVNPTASFTNTTGTTVRIDTGDIDSGVKRLRYQVSDNNGATYSSFTGWYNVTSRDVVLPHQGQHKIRVEVEDNVGNIGTYTSNMYQFNQPPVADFTSSPSTVYNNTTVSFTNNSSDPDGDSLTYQWAYQEPNSSTWVNFSTSTNPTRVLNKKGTWNIKLTASDGVATHYVTKPINVQNRAPVADFTSSPTTVYNNTTVTLTNNSSDVDGDSLTYQWAYQEPNSSTWINFSTSTSPTRVLNKKGSWNVKLTASDGTTSHSVTKSINVQNRAPVADFTSSPSTVYNNTTVTFTNNSSDVDGDSLTYQWAYQEPNSSSWVNFSTSTNPTRILNKQGSWNIRLIASDGTLTHSVTKAVAVQNRAPSAGFTTDKASYLTTDTIKVSSTATDPDNDALSFHYEVTQPNNQKLTFNIANPVINNLMRGSYSIKQTVTDPFGANHTITKTITVNEINLTAVSIDIVDTDNKSVSHLVVGRQYRAKVQYRNTGNLDVSSHKIGIYEDGELLTDLTIDSIKANVTSTVYLPFVSNKAGTNTFKATVDYPNAILESIETDNDTQVIRLVNRIPIPGIETDKDEYWIEDEVCIKSTAYDLDDDSITISYKIILPSGKIIEGYGPDFCFKVEEKGSIVIEQTVTDEHGESDNNTIIITVNDLFIKGKVEHTDEWLKIHQSLGNPIDHYYSGEKLLLSGMTPPAPSKYVKVTIIGEDVQSRNIEEEVPLNSLTQDLHLNEFFKEKYSNPEERIKDGTLMLAFEVEFQNGAVRNDIVYIQIIGSSYQAFKIHQTY
ncbi:PKD domain-containing protein [Sutcliffiella sp. NPDC057660]|uniref:PKD domain-containing protein n=1 Tax=Sutcliffiella sp. NPDC057660 TaxID=3346199 RepID=UPI0036A85CD0